MRYYHHHHHHHECLTFTELVSFLLRVLRSSWSPSWRKETRPTSPRRATRWAAGTAGRWRTGPSSTPTSPHVRTRLYKYCICFINPVKMKAGTSVFQLTVSLGGLKIERIDDFNNMIYIELTFFQCVHQVLFWASIRVFINVLHIIKPD